VLHEKMIFFDEVEIVLVGIGLSCFLFAEL